MLRLIESAGETPTPQDLKKKPKSFPPIAGEEKAIATRGVTYLLKEIAQLNIVETGNREFPKLD